MDPKEAVLIIAVLLTIDTAIVMVSLAFFIKEQTTQILEAIWNAKQWE